MPTFEAVIRPAWCEGDEFIVTYMSDKQWGATLAVSNHRTQETDWKHSDSTHKTTFDLKVGKYDFKFKFTKYRISLNGQILIESGGVPRKPWWKFRGIEV